MRKMGGRYVRFLVGFTVILGAASAASQEPSQGETEARRSVASDPDVRSGVLPNGMRYFVKQSPLPARGLSLRLGFDVGSFEEGDDERGFAHLVEHLAFRTTRSAPDGGLDARFAKLGVGFGRDQNGETTEFSTTYRIDFNSTDANGVEGFRWLRDVADGVIFSEDVIASEHGVVIAEQASKADESREVHESISRFQAPELRSTFRRPDGLPRARSSVKKTALQAFYNRWYRPENAVVVVIGDQSSAALEKQVHAHFSTWQATGTRPRRAPLGQVNVDRGVDALTLAAPSFPKAATACRLQGPLAPSTDERGHLDRETHRSIWQGVLNDRFKRIVNAGNGSLLAGMVVSSDNQEVSANCLVAVPTGNDWQKALAATQLELSRFAKDGPTEAELEGQVEELRSLLRGAISNANARTSTTIAESILEKAIRRRAIVSPAEAMHAFNVAVEDLDPTAVKAAFNADWSGAGPLLTLTMPSETETAMLREAWLQNAKVTAPAYADLAPVTWPYADFGKAGKVSSREEVARPGFTRIRFANGTVLNFKRLVTEPNTVELKADFGGGRRQIANDDYFAASFGAGLLIAGGLGRLPAADIDRAFRNISWQFDFDIRTHAFELSQSSLSANLPVMLQMFAAFMSDPGFRSDSDSRIPDAIDMVVRNFNTNPQMSVSNAMTVAIDPDNPERRPSAERLATLKSSEFARVLKAPITTEAIEVTIVGDVDEETVVKLVGSTFGALPKRPQVDRSRADTHFLRFPDRPFPVVRATHEGAADQAAARVIWPLYVATPARRREEYALQLVAAVFNEGLRARIRGELGKTYDPRVSTYMPDHADQGFLAADFASTPAEIDGLIAEAKNLAAKLAAGSITLGDVETVRQPKLSAFIALRQKKSWWAAAMSGSARRPESIDELMEYQSLMTSVTLDEVKAAAAKWLSAKPIVGTSLPKSLAYATASGSEDGAAPGSDKRGTKR